MSSTSNVLCRYYLQGACAFGDQCRFSHNKQDEASQVCKYYLQGNCAYGDKCRYEHSKPGWSARGQPPPLRNYAAPAGVPRPPVGPTAAAAAGGGSSSAAANGSMVKLPSGASEFGLVESAPNWDDYMTPDEMDEFEQWQNEQAAAAASRGGGGQQSLEGDEFDDIMDPADIPLCNEYAATGCCSAGEECVYIHGDPCEICGYYCIHPYNPDVTAHHKLACAEAMEAAGYTQANGTTAGDSHSTAEAAAEGGGAAEQAVEAQPEGDVAGDADDADQSAAAAAAATEGSAAEEPPAGADEAHEAAQEAAAEEKQQQKQEGSGDKASTAAPEAADAAADDASAAADKLAEKLADTHVSS